MRLTAQEIAHLVGGTLTGDPGIVITGANALADAVPGDLSFIAHPKYLEQAASSKASLFLALEGMSLESLPAVAVKNPPFAFAKVLTLIDQERTASLHRGIHPAAVISPAARLGAEVTVGPYAVIEDGAEIGDRTVVMAHSYVGSGTKIGRSCLIYPNVTVRENVSVGDRAIIHSGTVIGTDGFGFVPTPDGNFKIPQIGRVVIEDDVEIGGNVAIDRATTGATVIGKGTKIDNLVHIPHNARIGKHCLLCGQVGFAGSITIGDRVTFAGQSGSVGHITIGDGVTVAGKAGVTAPVPPNTVVSGFPARPHREELRREALIHRLPKLFEEVKELRKLLEKNT